ncbi:FitA-like ribbon-helix-helix domain-containing protein [Enterobacter hormaechei]|uniref:FitA-like ribbon-helix-helix domain-containing protein n=1 Tax=Enterobacter hormaechei TaxID=158836 RepID=UPI004068FDB2
MQRLNVRNIPDEIYRQFEQEAARQERSTEAHARFVIAQSVQREAALTGADRYRRELSARLRHLLPLVNEAASRPGPNTSRRWTRPPWRSASVRPTHWR